MPAKQPQNELVADLLSRAADSEIRQAGLRDAAKLLRAVIGLGLLLDDLSAAADIDSALRIAQRRAADPPDPIAPEGASAISRRR
jgi:hypothetical protein